MLNLFFLEKALQKYVIPALQISYDCKRESALNVELVHKEFVFLFS